MIIMIIERATHVTISCSNVIPTELDNRNYEIWYYMSKNKQTYIVRYLIIIVNILISIVILKEGVRMTIKEKYNDEVAELANTAGIKTIWIANWKTIL